MILRTTVAGGTDLYLIGNQPANDISQVHMCTLGDGYGSPSSHSVSLPFD